MGQSENDRCTIRGYLLGIVCDKLRVWDRIADAQIFAVPSAQAAPTTDTFARANQFASKPVLRDIDAAELKKVTAAPGVMRGTSDSNGEFCLVNPDYQGGTLDIYVCFKRIPTPSLKPGYIELEEDCCLFLGTIRPVQFQGCWYMINVVPSANWCAIRRKADAWVIVGRVTPCDDDNIGLGDLQVTAIDADIVQHDTLGAATTNANGIFRIDYPGAKFRQGTWVDIELFGGPDVFFEIVDADGNELLGESPLRGRHADRSNRDACYCVELCVDVRVPTPGNPGPVPTVWTQIGDAFLIPDSSSLNDFDADGYAGAARYAFHGSIRMVGSAPRFTAANNPVEYRFLVSDTTTPNGGAAPADADFNRIVGVGANAGLFAARKVGQMIRYAPYKVVNIVAQHEDLDAEGWLDVNASIARTFVADPTLSPADIADFVWVDLDSLLAINTHGLTSESNVPAGAAVPGDNVPDANVIGLESKAIRFEIREVIDKAANNFNTMPGSGTTLNSIVVNNNASFARVAMAEHLSSTACTPLSGAAPHVAFSVHHPHLRNVSIRVRSNDGAYDHTLNDAASKPATSDASIPLSGNTSASVNRLHNPLVDLPPGLHKCTYIVTLSVLRRLHTGDGAVYADTPQTSFYYEP